VISFVFIERTKIEQEIDESTDFLVFICFCFCFSGKQNIEDGSSKNDSESTKHQNI
jgi:hypothetical protein